MPTGIKVKDAMVSPVVTAKASQTVYDGAKLMTKEDIGSLVIIDGIKPIGIVTREDVINKIVAKNLQASNIQLKEIMSTDLVTCAPNDDIKEAAQKMSKYGYERIPVTDMGKVIGIISTREIAKVAPQAIEILRERLSIQEPEKFSDEEFTEGECELCGNFSAELRKINDRWVCVNCKEEAAEL